MKNSSVFRKVRLACVPEQVNIPITTALEKGLFASKGIDLELQIVPEGTGKMIEMLEKKETDMALTVSDGFIVARGKNRPVQLSGVWVDSPLVWTIAASPSISSQFKTIAEFIAMKKQTQSKVKVGISRPGSGSQSMASYMAMLHGLPHKENLEFVVANNFQGLRDGVNSGKFDLFLWETFTTKPWFDKGELFKLGDVPTPWPSFCFVTHDDLGAAHELTPLIRDKIFPILFNEAQIFKQNDSNKSVERIMKDHGHTLEDASRWLSIVSYAKTNKMPVSVLVMDESIQILKSIGLISEEFKLEDLTHHDNGIVTYL